MTAMNWTNITVDNNHFVSPEQYGAFVAGDGVTTGDPVFVDAMGLDYRPGLGSPLLKRVLTDESLIPADATGTAWTFPAPIGPFDN